MMTMIERVAKAMEQAELGYEMSLTSLIDGVSTYTLRYSDGETLTFDGTEDLYEHVSAKRRRTQARAAIEAMREPTDSQLAKAEEVVVGYDDFACGDGEIRLQNDCAATAWRKMIDAALNEKETT